MSSDKGRRHSAAVTTNNSEEFDEENDVLRRVSMGCKVDRTYASLNPPLSSKTKERWSSDKSPEQAFVANNLNFWPTQPHNIMQEKMGTLPQIKDSLNLEEKEQSKPTSWEFSLNKQQADYSRFQVENSDSWKAHLFKRKQDLVNAKVENQENVQSAVHVAENATLDRTSIKDNIQKKDETSSGQVNYESNEKVSDD